MLMKSQLHWAGHVSRMGSHHLPEITLYCELSARHRKRGAPKKRYKASLNKTLCIYHVDLHQRRTLAIDRQVWRRTVHQVIVTFEDCRRANLTEKRRWRKIRGASAAISDQTFECSRCLVGYQRPCNWRGQSPSYIFIGKVNPRRISCDFFTPPFTDRI